MADTSQAEQPLPAEPQTNGILDEEDKNKLRPADIDAVSFNLLLLYFPLKIDCYM